VTSRKLTLRVKIGILVSFKGNKIYYVYVPSRRDIVRTLHVTFDKSGIITSIGSAEDETPKETPSVITKGNRNRDVEENLSANIINVPEILINKDREKIRTLNHDNALLLDDDDFADAKETLRVTKLSNDEQGVTVPKLNTQTNIANAVKHDDASSATLKKRGRLLSSKNK